MNLLAAGYANQRLRDSETAESILTLESANFHDGTSG